MAKEHACEKCGKIFSQKGHFTNHMNRKTLCKPIVNKVIEEKLQEKLQELSENGDIEIKNKNLISNNINSNIDNMDNIDYNNLTFKSINKLIKDTKNYINKIDQILHNEGVNKFNRLDKIKYIIHNINEEKFPLIGLDESIVKSLKDILKNVIYIMPKSEISQQLYMFYGSIIMKNSLDQFYTPITISSFIKELVHKNKSYIDPAAGTGDLLIEFEGNINLWEISSEAIDMAKLNYKMANKVVTIMNTDSLKNLSSDKFDYCIENPPFGTKTVTNDKTILNKYDLGINREKQELGILFIELGLKLLKKDGILFAIIPGGYLGNNCNKYFRDYLIENTRILSIIKLPTGTFSRSGTGVSTYLIALSKNKVYEMNYNIHISEIDEIGYELNKKNTPIKYKLNVDGNYVIIDNKLVIDNDFVNLSKQIKKFAKDNNINELINDDNDIEYDKCNIPDILNDEFHVMETGRYAKKYTDIVRDIKNNVNSTYIHNLCEMNVDYSYPVNNSKIYKYIDISQVNTPLYNGRIMCGSKLPGRAKNKVNKNDIIISRLRGSISYSVILEDDIIVTNGMCVLRPKNMTALLTILSNLNTEYFKIQHQSLTTGSIMECISDKDIHNILIYQDCNIERYKKIYDAMITLNELF